MLKLPGVGHKIALIYMAIANNKVLGISVDTHIHRICNRLELVNTKNADQTMI